MRMADEQLLKICKKYFLKENYFRNNNCEKCRETERNTYLGR